MRFVTLLCCFLVASVASARDFKLGVVDMQKLFNSYPGTQAAKNKLSDLQDSKKADLTESAKAIKRLEQELSSSGSVLSAKEKERKKKEYADKLQAFNAQQEEVQKELMDKETEMTQDIVDRLKTLVAGVAKDAGVDLVLDSDKVVYTKDAVDLTDSVMKDFKDSSKDDSSK
jgi:outer membrane protein